MNTVIFAIEHLFHQVLSVFSHSIESAFDYFMMYPGMGIAACIVGYIVAVRATCR
jgi:hypothetical protein